MGPDSGGGRRCRLAELGTTLVLGSTNRPLVSPLVVPTLSFFLQLSVFISFLTSVLCLSLACSLVSSLPSYLDTTISMPPPAPSSASSFSPAPRLCLLVAEDAIRPSSLPLFYPHGIRGIYLLGQLCVGGIVGRIIGSKLGDLLMSASSSSLPRCHVSLSGNILLTVSRIA